MRVTVTVVGEATHDVSVAVDATHADLARAAGYSPHEVSVLVDDTHVLADQPVDADRVRVLRSIKGGSAGAPFGELP